MKTPEPLQKGDLIAIVAPAKAIEPEFVLYAKEFLEGKGFRITVSENCLGRDHYFSGSISARLSDFQTAINDQDVKAVLCARGGYGCVQLVDKINWSNLEKHPKWIIGFSDVSVFHQRLSLMGIESIHATMPLNFKENSGEALDSLISAITGEPYTISAAPRDENIHGDFTGEIVGGNLSILFSLLGTNDHIDYSNKTLFIEDLAEHIYHIDRIFYSFQKAGVLDKISGLIVGGMTKLMDTEISFGKSYEEVILSHVRDLGIPVCFDFPAGHIDDNRAVVFNKKASFTVNQTGATLCF
jgi:muramoyltetrapeptide carboxypeptidase